MGKKLRIGVLTAGGDCPGLNAAIRAVGKTAIGEFGYEVIGFRDGFKGLALNHYVKLDSKALSGILTVGGTILGTSRDRPHKMEIDGQLQDMTEAIIRNYKRHRLHVLICIGGGGTQKNALRLSKAGLKIVTIPKTIDNDIPHTDTAIGFDTALAIATEAIDRLHSTAHSHHRIVIVELMGHNTGWLTLGAGLAGGADVILIPEIPFDVEKVAAAIERRKKRGSPFSIVAVAEGAKPATTHAALDKAIKQLGQKPASRRGLKNISSMGTTEHTLMLALALERLTGLESRVSILGYVQRGGSPTAMDRIIATMLGTAAVRFASQNQFGIMLGIVNGQIHPIPLEAVANRRKEVPLDHPWIKAARAVGTCLGD